MVDDVVKAAEESINFEGRGFKVKVAARSYVINFGILDISPDQLERFLTKSYTNIPYH